MLIWQSPVDSLNDVALFVVGGIERGWMPTGTPASFSAADPVGWLGNHRDNAALRQGERIAQYEYAFLPTNPIRAFSRVPKTVLTEATGRVTIDVLTDRDGTFELQIVKKSRRRLNGVEEIVLSLYANGLTTGEIGAQFGEIYGASVSKETISRIADKVIEEMN